MRLALRDACKAFSMSLLLAPIAFAATNCPAPAYIALGWQKGTTVYYSTQGLDAASQNALTGAVNQWSTANMEVNGSDVTFDPVDSTHPATWTITGGASVVPPVVLRHVHPLATRPHSPAKPEAGGTRAERLL